MSAPARPGPPGSLKIPLPDPEATSALGLRLAGVLRPGDLVLLYGPIGAGKSHLARSVIQSLLASAGRHEDVPSPTFTLVQSYDTPLGEVIHADLYRLGDPRDLDDIGLTDAIGRQTCLIEWPEILDLPPALPHLAIRLATVTANGQDSRLAELTGPGWEDRLPALAGPLASGL